MLCARMTNVGQDNTRIKYMCVNGLVMHTHAAPNLDQTINKEIQMGKFPQIILPSEFYDNVWSNK